MASSVRGLGLSGMWCLVAAMAVSAGPADVALRSPPAERIPVAEMQPAIEGAVSAGVASILARILAEGNDSGLAYPPAMTRKAIGTKSVPARRVTYTEPVIEWEYAQVEQVVPETSAGQPTGGFVKRKVSVPVRSKQVGTRTGEHLVPDPNGTETMEVNEYGPGGPDIYAANIDGLNAMALFTLIRAGHPHHEAAERLAQSLADKLGTYGIPDATFDVAWLAAAFACLGKDSRHAAWTEKLVSKLIDGQIREKGEPRGLWGPVCINYPYFAKLFEMQGQLHHHLHEEVPKMLERVPPQQREQLIRQAQEIRRAYFAFLEAYSATSSQGTRMMDITRPWLADERSRLAGLPYYIYNRVVADIESTAVALFALAEAEKAGMLPAETDRVAIRGRKVHPPEKTEAALKLAGERLGAVIGQDGSCRALTFQATNTAFDKSKLPIPGLPWKGKWPPLVDLETAVTCVHGLIAIDMLTAASPQAAKPVADKLPPTRDRVLAIAQRWYDESAVGTTARWFAPFDQLVVTHGELAKSGALPVPEAKPLAVTDLPWGGRLAEYGLLPGFARGFADVPAKDLLEQPLYRKLAYRLLGLQDANGQWTSRPGHVSSAAAVLMMAQYAEAMHQNYQAIAPQDPKRVNSYYELMYSNFESNDDNQGYATLASLLFLLPAIEGPVKLGGVPILPPPAAPAEEADPAKPQPPPPATAAARGVERPNPTRAAVYEAVLAAAAVPAPAAAPAATPAAAKPDAKPPAKPAEPVGADGRGKVEDLLKPTP